MLMFIALSGAADASSVDVTDLSVQHRSGTLLVVDSDGNSVTLGTLAWTLRQGDRDGPKLHVRSRSVPAERTMRAFGLCASGVSPCENLDVEIPAGSGAVKFDLDFAWPEAERSQPLVFELSVDFEVNDSMEASDDGLRVLIAPSTVELSLPGVSVLDDSEAPLSLHIDGPSEIRVDGRVVPGPSPVVKQTDSTLSISYELTESMVGPSADQVYIDPFFQLRSAASR